MSRAEISRILGRGLTVEETKRLNQAQDQLSALFARAGYVVRVCEGVGADDSRSIGFVVGFVGSPLVSIPAAQFLSIGDAELLQILDNEMANHRSS